MQSGRLGSMSYLHVLEVRHCYRLKGNHVHTAGLSAEAQVEAVPLTASQEV